MNHQLLALSAKEAAALNALLAAHPSALLAQVKAQIERPGSITVGMHDHKHGTDNYVALVAAGARFGTKEFAAYLGEHFEPELDEEVAVSKMNTFIHDGTDGVAVAA